jgi:NitT/TauT family transport system permease protein
MFMSILPQVYDNSRITIGWCWTYVIIAEIVASENGIGHMIKEAQRFSNTPYVYVGIITMGIIGFGSDNLFKMLSPILFKYKQNRK